MTIKYVNPLSRRIVEERNHSRAEARSDGEGEAEEEDGASGNDDPKLTRSVNISIYLFILFYFVLFLFYFVLFYSILFYCILLYSIVFYSILFYSILFYSILFSLTLVTQYNQHKNNRRRGNLWTHSPGYQIWRLSRKRNTRNKYVLNKQKQKLENRN